MASPHVAGAAALTLAATPDATPAAIAQALVDEATPGLLRLPQATSPNRLLYATAGAGVLSAPLDAPPSPRLRATCRKDQCTLDATGSADDRGIARYEWELSDGTRASTTTTSLSHRFGGRGQHWASVTVVDTRGQAMAASVSIRVR